MDLNVPNVETINIVLEINHLIANVYDATMANPRLPEHYFKKASCRFSKRTPRGILHHIFLATTKNGMSSTELSRKLALRQKTCWLFKQKVMKAMESSQNFPMEGKLTWTKMRWLPKAAHIFARHDAKWEVTKGLSPEM